MKCLLLRGVVVVLVRGRRFGTIQAERIACARSVSCLVQKIGVVVQQSVVQAVDRRRPGFRDKTRLVAWVQRIRVGAEVVIKGDVLSKDDDDMLDGSGG